MPESSLPAVVNRKPPRLRAKNPSRVSLILIACTFFACIAWILFSKYVAPELIRSAYYRTAWPILNNMIVHQGSHPLSYYLARWNVFAWYMLLVLLVSGLSVFLAARPEFQNAFWGPEPFVPEPSAGPKPMVRGVTADAGKMPWREKLTGFANSREMALLIGAILLLALLLRVPSLGTRSLDEDEIFSAIAAHQHLPGFLWIVSHSEANMILYYILLRTWIHLGQSEFVIRSLSVIFALATLPALYSMGTRAFGRKVGSLGALLLAINGFHIRFAQDARAYSLLVFLITLSSLLFLQSVREGSRRNWICYIMASALAIYAHLFAVFVLVAHWVFVLFLPRRQAPWRRLVPSTAAIAYLAVPMELFVMFRGGGGQLAWVPRTTARSVYNLFACLAGSPNDSPDFGMALLLFVYSVAIVSSILALMKLRPWSMAHTETRHLAFFLTWLWVPILLIAAISIRNRCFIPRFLIICLPPFILLASYGVSQLRRAWLVVVLLCGIAGLTAREILIYYEFPGEDFRGAAQYVLSNQRPGDVAVFVPDYYQSCLDYYLQREAAKPSAPKLALLVLPFKSIDSLLQDLPHQYGRLWLITYRLWFITHENELEKRLIGASLATEFPWTQEEKRSYGVLTVVLYHE